MESHYYFLSSSSNCVPVIIQVATQTELYSLINASLLYKCQLLNDYLEVAQMCMRFVIELWKFLNIIT